MNRTRTLWCELAWVAFDVLLWLALCALIQSCAHVPHSPCLVST